MLGLHHFSQLHIEPSQIRSGCVYIEGKEEQFHIGSSLEGRNPGCPSCAENSQVPLDTLKVDPTSSKASRQESGPRVLKKKKKKKKKKKLR